MQIVRITTDFKNKKISFSVEQSITGEVLELMLDLVLYPNLIVVQAMDGCDNPISTIEYNGLETISHTFELDYASPNECATHEVVMSFESMMIRSIVPPMSHKQKD